MNLTAFSYDYIVDPANTRFSNAFGAGYTFPNPGSGPVGGGNGFTLQVGTEADDTILVNQFNMSGASIFGGNVMDVNTADNATLTLAYIKSADAKVSAVRSYYGAMQNRLEHTIHKLDLQRKRKSCSLQETTPDQIIVR